MSGAVATEAEDCAELAVVHDHVADNVGVLTRRAFRRAACGIGADQFQRVVVRAFQPVVVDFVALGATLDQVAAVPAVTKSTVTHHAMLQAEHGAGPGQFVGRHVDRVIELCGTGVAYLGEFDGQRAGILVGTKQSVAWTVANQYVADEHIVTVVIDAAKRVVGDRTHHFEALEHHMVGEAELDGIGAT
ncbi:MAG: hypothetical protein BWZ07_02784 [Alphaproteobacteria bacterium ADurb.BinA280]|nr:MAG: hypothetical protein BWZ07_02784 [Alphaproteobacteria bacterium ADurb.BinA280]